MTGILIGIAVGIPFTFLVCKDMPAIARLLGRPVKACDRIDNMYYGIMVAMCLIPSLIILCVPSVREFLGDTLSTAAFVTVLVFFATHFLAVESQFASAKGE